jgi:hypothetical protein
MTEDQINKFLTLLMGQCWHEWEWKPKDGDIHIYECKCGLRVGSRPQNPDHLSNPLPVLRWMREHMPDTWKLYLIDTYIKPDALIAFVDCILNLKNLYWWLIDHGDEWGYTDCPNLDLDDYVCRNFSPECECELGRIVHPALKYAKETQ